MAAGVSSLRKVKAPRTANAGSLSAGDLAHSLDMVEAPNDAGVAITKSRAKGKAGKLNQEIEAPVSSPKIPKQPRARFTVECILQAAESIILTKGYEYATTNYIAQVAGVSIGTVYQYFPRKEAIVAALVETLVVNNSEPVRKFMLTAMHKPLAECMVELIRLVLELRRKSVFLVRRLPREATQVCQDSEQLKPEMFLYSTTYLFFSHHRDEIKVADIEIATHVSTYLCVGVIDAHLEDPSPKLTDEQMIDSLSSTIIKYLTA
jgi:AcrR family transcriptional regulator